MFDQARFDQEYRVMHRHADGWAEMRPRAHHGPSDHDPERGWGKGVIFACEACQESVTLLPDEPSGEHPGS
jgi:hypothetical protein